MQNRSVPCLAVIAPTVLKLLTVVGVVFTSTRLSGQPYGYSFAKQITLLSSKVSGTNQTNFPVLISFTDNNLRTIVNGGHVSSNTGYDIIFTTDDCLTTLSHQIESYSPTTGAYIAWVKIPTLSISANTIIHMYYGNSTISINPSSTSVWDSNYRGVWHFNNAVSDDSSNGNNMTDNSTSNFSGSKVGNGRDLNNNTDILSSAAGQHLKLPNGFLAGMTNFTFEGWVYLDRSSTNWERIFDFGQSATVNFFLCPSTGNASPVPARARITINGGPNEQGPSSGNVTNTGSWIHWAVTLDNSTSTMTLYKDGAVLATASGVTLTPQNMEASTVNYLGRSQYAADHYIDAQFDEFRISTIARSSGWVTTSYNNQNSPSTFYTVSSEQPAGDLCVPLPVGLSSFDADQEGNTVRLYWTTQSEINNKRFVIERSRDGSEWSQIGTVPGAGTSNSTLQYNFIDPNVVAGRYYYRLLQIDNDGISTHSKVISVLVDGSPRPLIYSSSTDNEFVVEWSYGDDVEVKVFTMMGQQVFVPTEFIDGKIIMSTASLSSGIYVVNVYSRDKTFFQKVMKGL